MLIIDVANIIYVGFVAHLNLKKEFKCFIFLSLHQKKYYLTQQTFVSLSRYLLAVAKPSLMLFSSSSKH